MLLIRLSVPGDGAFPYGGLIFDDQGALYGTTYEGGGGCVQWHNGCGTVFKLTAARQDETDWKETVLYKFTPGDEGNCLDGAFPLAGLITDKKGGFYGTTWKGGGDCEGLGTVFKLTLPPITSQPPPATLACSTLCQRAPQYYLNNLSRLPNGTVQIAGGGSPRPSAPATRP